MSHVPLLTSVPFNLTSDELAQLVEVPFVFLHIDWLIFLIKSENRGQFSARTPNSYIRGIIIACQKKQVVARSLSKSWNSLHSYSFFSIFFWTAPRLTRSVLIGLKEESGLKPFEHRALIPVTSVPQREYFQFCSGMGRVYIPNLLLAAGTSLGHQKVFQIGTTVFAVKLLKGKVLACGNHPFLPALSKS